MTTLLLIAWVLLAVLLLLVGAVRPKHSVHSWFELKRRNDEQAMRRERLLADVEGMRRALLGILIVTLTVIGLALWQAWGVAAVIALWVVSGFIARQKPLRKLSHSLYDSLEPQLLNILGKAPLLGSFLRSDDWKPHDQKLESVEQLVELVNLSHIVGDDQRRIILHGLDWPTTPVKAVMTPKKDIVAVNHSELLGPLVLDDLHRSGHDRFPVTKGSLETIIGVLDITQLLEVDAAKRSETAEKAMQAQVLRIEADEPLPAALKLLEKSHQHMLIVIDKDGNTAGLVTLADITGSLIGR